MVLGLDKRGIRNAALTVGGIAFVAGVGTVGYALTQGHRLSSRSETYIGTILKERDLPLKKRGGSEYQFLIKLNRPLWMICDNPQDEEKVRQIVHAAHEKGQRIKVTCYGENTFSTGDGHRFIRYASDLSVLIEDSAESK